MRLALPLLLALLLGACQERVELEPLARGDAGLVQGSAPGELRRVEVEADTRAEEREAPAPRPARRPVVLAPTEGKWVLAGRVVDARGLSWPRGPVVVHLYGDGRSSTAHAGPDGRFRIGLEREPELATLCVHPPANEGWRAREAAGDLEKHQLTAAEASGAQELVFEIAQTRRGLVRGVAVSERTGAPLPDFDLELTHGDPFAGQRPETTAVTTDAEGRFALDLCGGRVTIGTRELGFRAAPEVVDVLVPDPSSDEEWIVPFVHGPRVRLVLDGAAVADPRELHAWITRHGASFGENEVALQVEDGELYARLPDVRDLTDPSRVLVVGDAAGLLRGSTTWSGANEDSELHVTLEETASLTVRFRAVPEPPAKGAGHRERCARLEFLDGELAPSEYRRVGKEWSFLPIGRYRVIAGAPWCEEVVHELRLKPREERTLEVDLEALPGLRRVTGTVRTASARALESGELYLSLATRPDCNYLVDCAAELVLRCGASGIDDFLDVEVGGESARGTFALEHVAPGELVIDVRGFGEYEHRVTVREEESGDASVDVLILDELHGSRVRFELPWEELANPSYAPTVEFRTADGVTWERKLSADEPEVELRGPADARLEWKLDSWRFQPLWGTGADFERLGEDRYVARLVPQRGWGERVRVVDAERRPLAGVRVSLDGAEAGVTDATGRVVLGALQEPVEVGFEASGYAPRAIPLERLFGDVVLHPLAPR